jgi:hypothetical protein
MFLVKAFGFPGVTKGRFCSIFKSCLIEANLFSEFL